MTTSPDPGWLDADAGFVVAISPAALEQILQLRDGEDDPEALGLGVRISGATSDGFRYETAFLPLDEITDGDLVEVHGTLSVVIPHSSVDDLRGATLDLSSDPTAPGLVMRNPNLPSPSMYTGQMPPGELSGTVEEKIVQLLDSQINPAIAAHGGYAELAMVDGAIAYLRLGGGCQGCGLAAFTLREGIEQAIVNAIPEIESVADLTDHAGGTNPYYEPAAK